MITEELTCVGPAKLRREDGRAVEWLIADAPVDYPTALTTMKERAVAIARGEAQELAWLVEHPPLYTAGTSSDAHDLLQPNRFPVYEAGRGGEYTYHGPGQRVVYLMLDLRERGRDVRCPFRASRAGSPRRSVPSTSSARRARDGSACG
jgi:lipoyl(octanoyl) transferase